MSSYIIIGIWFLLIIVLSLFTLFDIQINIKTRPNTLLNLLILMSIITGFILILYYLIFSRENTTLLAKNII